jgi:hypothetical protein
MADPGIATPVRYWIHYSNLASSFYKQYWAAKKIKDEYEKQILDTLQKNSMSNATIQIGGGAINVVDRREPAQLSLTKVEELLHGYFKQKGGRDESLDCMTYIKANRGYNNVKSLKQSSLPR